MAEDPTIEKYRTAYFNLHGAHPMIEKRGAWLVIGEGSFPIKVRKSDLPGMTSQLIWRLKCPTATPTEGE